MAKNFSTLLALRYLNPIRTHVSVITLISLIGVALGVMVLIVVLSVMDGFEDLIKSRVLGREPHIVSQRVDYWHTDNPEKEWRDHAAALEAHENVTNVYPLVRDYVFVEYQDNFTQADIKGMDTSNSESVADFKALISGGDGDMGEGYVVTMSSVFAETTGLGIGDKIELISTRNLKQLKPILDQKDYTPLKEQQQRALSEFRKQVELSMVENNGKEQMPNPISKPIKESFQEWQQHEIRSIEIQYLEEMLVELKAESWEESADGLNFYPQGTKERLMKLFDEIENLNVYKADNEAINEVALPREVEIVAIYQTDIYAPGPQLIAPMSVAQELSGINDTGIVSQIAVHVNDPYKAQQELEGMKSLLTDGWQGVTWMQQHEKQFSLISSQKSMMVIALSFIILIAVFSIGAVMFTITYQKKKEIGVMMALGATSMQITKVFTLQGVIVGFFGAMFGWLLSVLVLRNLDFIQDAIASWGFNPFDKSFYGVDSMPYITNERDVVMVVIGAFILCTLAALGPAWIASRADAAKSLRNM